jgi:prepilin-type processing-associated H-X9-DG protein
MPEVFQCPAAKRNTNKAWINNFGTYRFNYYAIGRSASSSRAMTFIDTCWNDWPKADFSHQKPAGLNVAYADGHITFMDHAAYLKTNPASSAEKNNRFFTQGWLE